MSRQDRFEKMLDRLNLSADQKTQVHQILSDTRGQLQTLRKESEPRFEEIRRQADERLQKVLTPEQWQQFQKERSEMRGRGRRRN
jgi:Spy/CpxP family protein refolding chaperone